MNNTMDKGGRFTYIGETSRVLRSRVSEHMNNLTQIKKESFGVLHWMLHHPLSPVPPCIKFKRVSSHKDALSRQLKEALLILREGTLNKRDEFSNNEVVRMETTRYTWDEKLEL